VRDFGAGRDSDGNDLPTDEIAARAVADARTPLGVG
jgi:hypothetical protein